GLVTIGASPAQARSDAPAPIRPGPADSFLPTPPSVPSPLLYTIHDAEVVEGDEGAAQVLAFEITASKAIVADDVVEADEEFVVEMSNAQGGTIVGGGGLGTILDDDAPVVPWHPGSFKAAVKALGQTVWSSVPR